MVPHPVLRLLQLDAVFTARLRAFQRAIDEVRTLALTSPKGGSKSELWFKNEFPYISVLDEASDFKLDIQLEFAKAHHQISPEEKVGVALG